MNEDPTKELPQRRSFEEQVLAQLAAIRSEAVEIRTHVLAELAAIRGEVAEIRVQQAAMAKNIAGLDERVTSLEETVEARLKETRPIWEAVQAQIEKLDQKFDIVIRDLYDARGDMALHAKRISQLEHAISS
jgi:chromosome segregation ATPase